MKKLKMIAKPMALFYNRDIQRRTIPTFGISSIFKSFSEFNHSLELFFLTHREGKSQFANMKKSITANLPHKNLFSRVFSGLSGGIVANKSSESIFQPIDKFFLCVGNLKHCLKGWISSRCFGIGSSRKATFSVYNTGKICNILNSILFFLVRFSSISFFRHQSFLKKVCVEVYQKQRLSAA